jgi:cadmium resistance protein CadD (predicted permease)
VFFADSRLNKRSVVGGQFLGMGAVILLSVAGALLAWAIPLGWLGLLGFVPLGLGLARLPGLFRRNRGGVDPDERLAHAQEDRLERRLGSQSLAVAAVVVANGADNLGVYIPLFAAERESIVLYLVLFSLLTAVWCVLAYRLVKLPRIDRVFRRFGHLLLPFVLIALGLRILSGSTVLVQ